MDKHLVGTEQSRKDLKVTEMAIEIYQNHLNRVSRSFAACIARLESPLRGWVSLTYLICRILDTVEDAKWSAKNQQALSFQEFDQFLNSPETLDKVSTWAESFPEGISEGERLLVQDAKKIFSDLHKSPTEIKKIIQELVGSMSRGMAYFSSRATNGKLKLEGLKEVNQYCFFVAGIVGETLSKLVAARDAQKKFSKSLFIDAHHFGLFLQKVNLLKDQFSDEKEGRFLIPSRVEVISSLRENADGAMRYIESLPREEKGYRVFCLWSLFLGLRTLPLLTEQVTELSENKISREETLALFDKIEEVACENEYLRSMYIDLMNQINWPSTGPQVIQLDVATTSPVLPDASTARAAGSMSQYKGTLEQDDFKSLGLC